MSNIVVKQINGGPTGVINAIINGNFGINQRGVSGTVTLASGVYGHDRWKAGSGGCTYTFATVANVTTLTITAGTLIQVIEGLNLSSGTYTLSFAGTAQGKIGAGSFAGSGVTGTAVGGTNLNIEFNSGTVSLVQFELGSVATPFERRPFSTELALCQRYFQILSLSSYRRYVVNVDRDPRTIPITMRATPTLLKTVTSSVNLGSDNSAANTASTWVIDLQYTAGGTGVIDIGTYSVFASAEL